MGWASVLGHYNGATTLAMYTDGQTEEGRPGKPACRVGALSHVKDPVLMPQRSPTSQCTFLTLWAWDIKVAVFVGIAGSFLPESADAAVQGVVVRSRL